jgi:gamma-glutamyltranspeptidase/glutathione hydrolase
LKKAKAPTDLTMRELKLIVIVLAGCLALPHCSDLNVEKLYSNGVVASSSPIASAIGLEILKSGGNAFDAAVATALAAAVSYPQAGNIGGGGFALIYDSQTKRVKALDFREIAPGAATPNMFLDDSGKVIENESLLGVKAAGVPGTVAGLYELWQKHGSLTWFELVKPAMDLADSGFVLSPHMTDAFKEYQKDLARFEETRKVFFENGTVLSAGKKLVQKDLAATLERIGLSGDSGFYFGPTADLIVAAMQKHGGLITKADLEQYKPVWRQPLSFEFDTLQIFSMPPPSSGGVIMGQILKLLEPFDFYGYSPDHPEYIHLFTEACRLAYADRAVHLGDPDFVHNPVTELLDSTYLESRRSQIDIKRAGRSEKIGSGLPDTYQESENTTHFSVVDKDGNAVSITYTINTAFGSKLIVDGAGFLLNNEMDDFSLSPGVPNFFGLLGGQANAIAPHKRMLSSMSPTIILKKGQPYLVLGSPGGSRIITAVAQTILNVVRFDQTISTAVATPRFHHQWLPDTLALEEKSFAPEILDALKKLGHSIKETKRYSDVEAILIDDDGFLIGASDPRGEGAVAAY